MHSKMHRDASGESANQRTAEGVWVMFSTVQHCQTDGNTVQHVQETVLVLAWTFPAHPFRSSQVKSVMRDKGVAQPEAPLDVMCLLFFDL